MAKINYSGYRFPPMIIQQAIWLYARFTLSFRDAETLRCRSSARTGTHGLFATLQEQLGDPPGILAIRLHRHGGECRFDMPRLQQHSIAPGGHKPRMQPLR
jgi:hypothetical protein